jgi:hypothetical protein
MADGNMETLSIGLNLDISQFDENTQRALRNIQQISANVTKANSDMGSSSSGASSNVKDLNKNLDQTAVSGKGAGQGINSAAVNMAAAIKIIETIIKVVKKLIGLLKEFTAAADAEYIALTKLNTILGNTFNVTSDYTNSLFSYIKAMEQAGAVSSDALVQATQTLSSYTTSLGQLEDLIPAVADLTASLYGTNATAQNAQTLATAIGRALNGSAEALTRYGVQLSESTKEILKSNVATQAEKVAAIVADIEGRVGGMNEALGKTYRGQINQIKASLQDIKQNIGYIFENFITPLLPAIKQWVNHLKQVSELWVQISTAITGVDSRKLTDVGKGMAEGLEDADEAANKLNRTLAGTLGIDELNVLNADEQDEEIEKLTDQQVISEETKQEISEIVNGVKEFLSLFSEYFSILRTHLKNIFNFIKQLMGPIMDLLKPVISIVNSVFRITTSIIGVILESLIPVLKPIIEVIAMIADYCAYLMDFTADIIEMISHVLRPILEILLMPLQSCFEMLEKFKPIVSVIGEMFKYWTIPLSIVMAIIETLFELMKALVKTFAQLLQPWEWFNIDDTWEEFGERVAAAWNRVGEMAQQLDTSSVSATPAYASGGFPEDGLFYANHGELIGQFNNGRTVVANNEQIVEGIKQGVYEAMIMAGGGDEKGGTQIVVYLDSNEIAKRVEQRSLARKDNNIVGGYKYGH